MKMPAYSELYVADIVEYQGYVFLNIREELPGVDEKWFIEAWMKSETRSYLDQALAKWAGMPPQELIWWSLHHECNEVYQKGEKWGGFLPQWVGIMYALYQWKFDVPSAKIIEVLPLDTMEKLYVPYHQLGDEAAVNKLHEYITSMSELEGESTC